jgi:hypothetical protein
MLDKVVAKMQCHYNREQDNSDQRFHSIRLGAVYAGYEKDKENGENAVFGKWTPFAECNMAVANPSANEFFKEGKKYYVTFTEAPD